MTAPFEHTRLLPRGLLVAGLAFCWIASARGQTVDPDLWMTDGKVYAIVREGDTIYLGGRFDHVGPATGSGVPIDPGSAAPQAGFPMVGGGAVDVVAPDGLGGWYIGGSFTSVGGVARSRAAHIAADLSVTAWNPDADGTVLALVVSGSTVYVGGRFGTIGGQPRLKIAALDAVTGAATPWNPGALSGNVNALAVSGSTVYAGGSFREIGGQPRDRIAALDTTSGMATSWDPGASSCVCALAVSSATVYAGGWFTAIGGQPRSRIAALEATTGLPTPWNPGTSGINPAVHALLLSGSTLYVGGTFSSIGGYPRSNVAALDVGTGVPSSWSPNPDDDVLSLALSGSTVYLGGSFTTVGGYSRPHIAGRDAATGAVNPWNPGADGRVSGLAASETTVFAGGVFGSVGAVPRANLAALDAGTGVATAWNPGTDAAVHALAVSGATVYAGGDFTSVGIYPRDRIAALQAATGIPWPNWHPSVANVSGADFIRALAVAGSTLYVGGRFSSIELQQRSNIAALEAATGAVTSWAPNAVSTGAPSIDTVYALAVSGGLVYAGGYFNLIGGQQRSHIAALDPFTGLATPWDPDADGRVRVVAVAGATVYAGGEFTDIGGQPRNRIAALDAGTGAATPWDADASGVAGTIRIEALSVSTSAVYAGGRFDTIGGQPRTNLAALDAATGTATSWDSPATGRGDTVFALEVSGPTLYAGGDFSTVAGELHVGLAAISTSTITGAPLHALEDDDRLRAWPNPFHDRIALAFGLESPADALLEVFDVTGRRVQAHGPTTLRPGRARLTWDGRLNSGGPAPAGVYFLRVRGGGLDVSQRVVRIR